MPDAMTIILIVGAAFFAVFATWALCILADDPPVHCTGCTDRSTPSDPPPCGLPGSHVR